MFSRNGRSLCVSVCVREVYSFTILPSSCSSHYYLFWSLWATRVSLYGSLFSTCIWSILTCANWVCRPKLTETLQDLTVKLWSSCTTFKRCGSVPHGRLQPCCLTVYIGKCQVRHDFQVKVSYQNTGFKQACSLWAIVYNVYFLRFDHTYEHKTPKTSSQQSRRNVWRHCFEQLSQIHTGIDKGIDNLGSVWFGWNGPFKTNLDSDP